MAVPVGPFIMYVLAFAASVGLVWAMLQTTKRLAERFMGMRLACPTRNMSYDLRGEAHLRGRASDAQFPFMMSTIGPHRPEDCRVLRGLSLG